MTVKLRPNVIKGGRTSFGCYYHGRYIYIVGGNETNSMTSSNCCRYDIFTFKWELLPSLKMKRANPCTFVKDNYLFAIGGFEYNGYSQFALNTMEKLDLRNIKAGWVQEHKLNDPLVPESTLEAKACFYSIEITQWLHKETVPFEDQPETDNDT